MPAHPSSQKSVKFLKATETEPGVPTLGQKCDLPHDHVSRVCHTCGQRMTLISMMVAGSMQTWRAGHEMLEKNASMAREKGIVFTPALSIMKCNQPRLRVSHRIKDEPLRRGAPAHLYPRAKNFPPLGCVYPNEMRKPE